MSRGLQLLQLLFELQTQRFRPLKLQFNLQHKNSILSAYFHQFFFFEIIDHLMIGYIYFYRVPMTMRPKMKLYINSTIRVSLLFFRKNNIPLLLKDDFPRDILLRWHWARPGGQRLRGGRDAGGHLERRALRRPAQRDRRARPHRPHPGSPLLRLQRGDPVGR